MFWERKLEHWVDHIRENAALPLRLQLWNGQRFDFGKQAPEVTVTVPHVSSLPFLLKPTLANLGRAYVEGKLLVEGRAKAVISVANALAAHTLKAKTRPGFVGNLFDHTRRKDAEAIQYHYDVSNAFYQLWLDRKSVV